MKTIKVTVDGAEFENVTGWYIAGSVLVLNFVDGSIQGIADYSGFEIEPSNDKF